MPNGASFATRFCFVSGHDFSRAVQAQKKVGLKSLRESRRISRRYHLPRIWWEPPASAGGSWTSVQRKSDFIPKRTGFSPGFSRPALKRIIEVQLFSATLKRCSPLLKQRAPTKLAAPFKFSPRHFSPCAFFHRNFVRILQWQGLKPSPFWLGVARLKSCPDTKQKSD